MAEINACGPFADQEVWIPCSDPDGRQINISIGYAAHHDPVKDCTDVPSPETLESIETFIDGLRLSPAGPGFETDFRVTLAINNSTKGVSSETTIDGHGVIFRSDPSTAFKIFDTLRKQSVPSWAFRVELARPDDVFPPVFTPARQ